MQKLTRREKEVFNLLLDGSIPKEIAGKLKISYDTVLSHQKKIYRKLDVHSIDELQEKYSNKKEEVLTSANGKSARGKLEKFIKTKYLISAGLAIILIISIFVGLKLILPQLESKVRRKEAENSFDPPRIYLEDGTYFIANTFDKVHLFANRWVNEEDLFYGEQYYTDHQIFLNDIYSGTIDNLLGDTNSIRLRLSGEVNKELKMVNVSIHYIYQGQWYYKYQGNIYNSIAHSKGRQISISPGPFKEEFLLIRETFTPLPEGGYFLFSITNTNYVVNHGWVDDTGERLPPDMPNGTICATINNLKIEPVDRIAK